VIVNSAAPARLRMAPDGQKTVPIQRNFKYRLLYLINTSNQGASCMYPIKKILNPFLNGVVIPAALATGVTQALAEEAPGYIESSQGNILRSGSGDCVHTGYWKPGMATIVGCDGVTLDAPVEVIEGAPTGLVGAIVIPEAALFAFDKAELTEEGKKAIETYRKELRPEIAEAYAGIIIGHTDSTGNAEYNLGLSKRRAQAVSDYLVSTGVDAGKLREVGRGEEAPIASNDTPEGRTQNRRVEIIAIAEPRALDTIRFPSVVLFPRRSAELTEQGKDVLATQLQEAREMLSRAAYIEVIGHTDDVGDDAYNQELSEQRAASVRNYLAGAGVDASKMVTVGAGELMPIASNKTDEGRAENRRVEVMVLGRVK
jgi:OOP family OmpA-OmpF porin